MKRKQFTFYESYYSAIKRIKNKTAQRDAFVVLCEYALNGEEPDLDKLPDAVAIAFELVRPTLDSSRRKAENGKKGGSKKQTASKPQANGKQTASEGEIEKENEEENENENEIEKENKVENECIKADFALFWEAYPRKEGIQKAEEAFAKVVVPVQDLLDAIAAQKKSKQWLKDGGLYIPHPAKWLEERRWMDQMVGTPCGATGALGEAEMAAIENLMRTK